MPDRYNKIEKIQINNVTTLRSFPDISPDELISDTDIFHKVTNSDRFDILAFTYYGDATKWWIIMLANGFSLPTDLTPGDVIRIPKSTTAAEALIKRKVNQG